MQNQEISYSPTRLATAYYCGVRGKHRRVGGGTTYTQGIHRGEYVDNCVAIFFKHGIYTPIDELDYVIYNSKQNSTKNAIVSENVSGTFIDDNTKRTFNLAGFTDVSLPHEVIEIKTGEPKIWHEIQALSYATINKVPCRIMYVSKTIHKTIEPDEEKLIKIMNIAYDNELSEMTNRSEICKICPLKSTCVQWQSYSPYLRIVAGAKELLESNELNEEETKEMKNFMKNARKLALSKIDYGHGYALDDYKFTPFVNVNGTKGLSFRRNK